MSGEHKVPELGDWVRQRVFERYGIRGILGLALLAGAFFVWTQWSTVSRWPGISSFVAYVSRDPLPQADPHRFSVAIAHLEDDDANRTHEKLIVRLLHEFEGVQVLALDRTIPVHGSLPEEQERKGHEKARQYLEESNASVLIWGRVLEYGDQSKPDLYLTAAAGQDGRSRQYTLDAGTEFSLPNVFWEDLADVLRLVIGTQAAQFDEGHYVADRLQPFIARVRTLLKMSTGRPGWGPRQRASTQYLLANALLTLGLSGQIEFLEQAVETYEKLLREWSDERVWFEWDNVQLVLGFARLILGTVESGTRRLEQALESFDAVLKLWSSEQVPLQWAVAQVARASAFSILGHRETGPRGRARLQKAVETFQAVLDIRSHAQMYLGWLEVQNGLGVALQALGEREDSTIRLTEAVEVYRGALEECARERELFICASIQHNLALTFLRLRERESGITVLKGAIAAYRADLDELTDEQVLILWTVVRTDLGFALVSLGEHERGTGRLEEAVAIFKEMLEVWRGYSGKEALLLRAYSHFGLGDALRVLGERESGTVHMKEGVRAYRAALEVYTREWVPLRWAQIQTNLGKTLFALGERTKDCAMLEVAREAVSGAFEVYMQDGQEHRRADFEGLLSKIDVALAGMAEGTLPP